MLTLLKARGGSAQGNTGVGDLLSVHWTNGTGDGSTAYTDGGQFNVTGGNNVINSDGRTMDVVAASGVGFTSGTLAGYAGNVLRLRMRQGCYAQMTKTDAVPLSTSHYGRFYVRNDAGRRTFHGSGMIASASGGSFNHWQLLHWQFYGGTTVADPWRFGIRTAGAYPNGIFRSPNLSRATVYRYEYHVEYITATTVKVHPRLYDVNGTLLYDGDDFRNDDEASSLTTFYASNTIEVGAPDDTPNAEEARDLTIGLEDPSDANGYDPVTPAYIYLGKLDLSSTGWLGA